jgi:hypothetical protein
MVGVGAAEGCDLGDVKDRLNESWVEEIQAVLNSWLESFFVPVCD